MEMANMGKTGNVIFDIWLIFDVQTSYGGLKVSEFHEESISEV